jgi:hypothetical protein
MSMHAYLVHRMEVAAKFKGKLFQSRINLLHGQLDARGKTGGPDLPSNLIVPQVQHYNKSVAGQKAHKDLAQKAFDSFLSAPPGSPNAGPVAKSLKEELDLLAGYIKSVVPMATWIKGPLKKVPKAMGKAEKDYAWVWSNSKDLVRGTMACESQSVLSQIASCLVTTCVNEYAMSLMKKQEQKSIRDKNDVAVAQAAIQQWETAWMAAGYSGWNFVVDFKEHKFGAEVQANTYSMMYGKMSKEDFCSHLNVSIAQYEDRRRKAGFPGGLSHALYDIQDDRCAASKQEKDAARALAQDYNDLCRGGARKPDLRDVNNRIKSITFTSFAAIKLWRNAVAGCGGFM